jgi:hypothetical protein
MGTEQSTNKRSNKKIIIGKQKKIVSQSTIQYVFLMAYGGELVIALLFP